MTPFNIYLWGIVDPLRAGILAINIVLFSAAAISESQAIQRDLPDLYNAAVKKLKAELGVQAEK